MKEIAETLKNADGESTRSPYWLIIDPRQMLERDVCAVVNMITGPFFCREDAEEFLRRTRYNFTPYAVVYCLSGNYSDKYDSFCASVNKT